MENVKGPSYPVFTVKLLLPDGGFDLTVLYQVSVGSVAGTIRGVVGESAFVFLGTSEDPIFASPLVPTVSESNRRCICVPQGRLLYDDM